MGLISGILGSTPLATSAMKGSKYAEEHPDDPAGGYGGPGIIGTLLKMYLGGAIGGALGGAAGGGASGMTGAANGVSGITSGLSGGGGGIMDMLGGSGGGSLGGLGGMGEAAGGGMMGGIGDMAQKAIGNSSGGGGGQGSGQAGKKAQAEEADPNSLENMMFRMQNMAGNAQKNQTGLMNIPGIPDYFKQQMSGWSNG